MEAKIVIGANYGDEGKGFCVDELTRAAVAKHKKVLNVLFNGGPQRGHTVDYPFSIKHIYHHFGAGTLSGADTYFTDDFMVNPMVFVQEYQVLDNYHDNFYSHYHMRNSIYVNPYCRVTTPWDMMANQISEMARSKENKHGTCGYGIWNTVCRYQTPFQHYYEDLTHMTDTELTNYFIGVRQYYQDRIEVPETYKEAWRSLDTIRHFIHDLRFMSNRCITTSYPFGYDVWIFEAGQGLGLDFDVDPVYATASKTGSKEPVQLASICGGMWNIEIIYVSRSYLTRHGEGPLPNELPTVQWNSVNETNADNPWQGHLRIGKLDLNDMMARIDKDRAESDWVKSSLFMTHMNEPGVSLDEVNELADKFYNIYTSSSKLSSDIPSKVTFSDELNEDITYNKLGRV